MRVCSAHLGRCSTLGMRRNGPQRRMTARSRFHRCPSIFLGGWSDGSTCSPRTSFACGYNVETCIFLRGRVGGIDPMAGAGARHSHQEAHSVSHLIGGAAHHYLRLLSFHFPTPTTSFCRYAIQHRIWRASCYGDLFALERWISGHSTAGMCVCCHAWTSVRLRGSVRSWDCPWSASSGGPITVYSYYFILRS